MYRVVLKKSAQKDLDRLPKLIQRRVSFGIEDLCMRGPSAANVKKLHDPLSGFRKRVGNYRILFDINKDIVLVHRIKKRDKAY